MGSVLSFARRARRKRQRGDSACETAAGNGETSPPPPRPPEARMRLEGEAAESRYGCHTTFYPTADAGEAHALSLGWDLRRAALPPLLLLALCRVATSCRKSLVLYESGGGESEALELRYTAVL